MNTIPQIQARRLAILDEIRSIDSMRRGTINEQFFPVQRQGQKQKSRRGPYYVLSRREGHKIVSRRLTSPEDLEQARQDVVAYKKFQGLCREFEQVTERLAELGRAEGQEKKRLKPESNKTGK
ncbi:MAG: hypothetical protein Q8O91_12630 [Candidatus Aminicenantes bacterium]|nr:hypothetical protein [Candidatus Aminicenantes bacterium]